MDGGGGGVDCGMWMSIGYKQTDIHRNTDFAAVSSVMFLMLASLAECRSMLAVTL